MRRSLPRGGVDDPHTSAEMTFQALALYRTMHSQRPCAGHVPQDLRALLDTPGAGLPPGDEPVNPTADG